MTGCSSAIEDRKRRGETSGFSLLELAIVVVLVLVIGTIAIPNMITVISNARLRGGATSLSGLLQNCRMLAVKQNKTKTTLFTTLATGPVAFVKNPTDAATLLPTDPQVQLGAPLSKQLQSAAPGPLTSGVLGFTAVESNPSFNSRGLPCAYSGGVCTNSGFVYYFRDVRPMGRSGWAAVSISPAGRIKRWFWNGSSWGD